MTTSLDKLKTGKSRGVDNIPAEVLRFAGATLKKYLLVFYNKIWSTGAVPELLNVIKCILLFKSGDSLDMMNYRQVTALVSKSW